MLNLLRRAVKSWVAKIMLALLIASFAIWGIGDIFSFRLDSAVARVGDTKVPADRFAESLRREQARLSQQAGQLISIDTIRQLGLDRRVLAGQVRDAAYAEELKTLGISAPDEAVAEAIRADPTFQGPAGEFSDATYRALLTQQGMSAAEFENLTRRILGQQILIGTVASGSVPSASSVRIAEYRGETRDVSQLMLTSDMADPPGEPDAAALQAQYEANPERYTEPERRYGRYIHVDIAKLAEDAQPTEEAVREVYETEKDRFTAAPTRTIDSMPMANEQAAQDAMARINSGEADFDAIATERGLDPASLSLGTVTPDDLPDVTAGPVFEATEAGVIGPVPTPVGSSIVRITAVSEGGVAPFEDVQERLARRLASDAALDAAPDIANQIEEERAAGKPLDEIAQAVRLPLGTIEGIAGDGSLADGTRAQGFEATETFRTEVFDALDLEERDIIETEDGGFLLVMIDRVEPRALKPLDEVKDQVSEDWAANARLQALEAKAAELVGRLAEGAAMAELATELDLPLSEISAVGRFDDDANLPNELVMQLFATGEGGTAIGRAPTRDGVILAEVTAINMLSPEDLAAAAAEVEQVLSESLANDTVEYYGRAVEARHGTSVDQVVLDEVFRLISGGDAY